MKQKLKCVLVVVDDKPDNLKNKYLIAKAGIATHVERLQSPSTAITYLSFSAGKEADLPFPELILLDTSRP